MKTTIYLLAVLFILSLFVTSPVLTSCTKEKIVRDTVVLIHHDTTIINHFDTTLVYLHDTTQISIGSCNNPFEGYVNSYFANDNANGVNQLTIGAWTHSGSAENSRSFLKFDYKDFPSNPIIISAKLSLYAMPAPGSGNMVDAHYGTANSFYIRRITSALNMPQINWGNQPSTSTQNQVLVPQATSSTQNNTDIDVTNIVKDMFTNGNNGFFLQLQSETTYNSRQYCSSFHSDVTKRPKLVIQYKKQ